MSALDKACLGYHGAKLNSYSQGTYTVVYEVNNCLRENHLLYFNVYVYVPTSAGQAGGIGGTLGAGRSTVTPAPRWGDAACEKSEKKKQNRMGKV